MGIMLYGEGRVSQRVMFFATLMVSVGTLLSTTWILAANSWMQTPAGYKLVHGQYEATNWLHAIFNPSFGWRYPHLVVGVLISASWMLVGISAWYLVKRRHLDLARRTVSIGLGTLVVLMPIQIYVGDQLAGFMGSTSRPSCRPWRAIGTPTTAATRYSSSRFRTSSETRFVRSAPAGGAVSDLPL
jgi:cytochrome bd ubiquinol oxidase subunit I